MEGGNPPRPRGGSKKDKSAGHRPRSQAGMVQFLTAAEAMGNNGGAYMPQQEGFPQPPIWDTMAPPPPPPPPPAPPPPYEDFPCGPGSIIVDPYGMGPPRDRMPMIAQVHEVRKKIVPDL